MKRMTMSAVFVLSAALAGCATEVPSEPSTSEATQATIICTWNVQCSTTGAVFSEFGFPSALQQAREECLANCAGGTCGLISRECNTI
jgi:hypothetical protein